MAYRHGLICAPDDAASVDPVENRDGIFLLRDLTLLISVDADPAVEARVSSPEKPQALCGAGGTHAV